MYPRDVDRIPVTASTRLSVTGFPTYRVVNTKILSGLPYSMRPAVNIKANPPRPRFLDIKLVSLFS